MGVLIFIPKHREYFIPYKSQQPEIDFICWYCCPQHEIRKLCVRREGREETYRSKCGSDEQGQQTITIVWWVLSLVYREPQCVCQEEARCSQRDHKSTSDMDAIIALCFIHPPMINF